MIESLTKRQEVEPWSGAGIATQVLVLTARSVRAVIIDPRLVAAGLVGPLLMLLVFSQVFATVASTPDIEVHGGYIEFLVPAIMVNTALQTALGTAFSLIHEMRSGVVTRFRTLPISAGSVLVARNLADLFRGGIQLILLLCCAVGAFGYRPGGGLTGMLAAWALALLVGAGLGWIFLALACWMKDVELMQSVSSLITFPLMFGSTAFMPINGLPDWLKVVATINPMTYGIDAARELALGFSVSGSAIGAAAVSGVVAVMFAPIAVRGFGRESN